MFRLCRHAKPVKTRPMSPRKVVELLSSANGRSRECAGFKATRCASTEQVRSMWSRENMNEGSKRTSKEAHRRAT
eukprot:14955558-Alexandrium_andersonii.AAC.1